MEYIFNTRLRGNIALTDSYHTNLALQKDNTLYKFIWVQSGSLQLEIDHVPTTLVKGEIIPLTPLHHIEFKAINGEYLTLLLTVISIVFSDMTMRCRVMVFFLTGLPM